MFCDVKALLIILSLATSSLHATTPPAADRAAILSMAGTFNVTFQFTEDVALASDYEITSKPYREDALEVVLIAEDTPGRVVLQHLLLFTDPAKETDSVIKHWAQVWTWQDTEMLTYTGEDGIDAWSRTTIPAEQASGTWTQLVTSIDDTPRYESTGKWQHKLGISTWTGSETARPLPRREYSKRDDYDHILGTNTHTIGANGWLHFQNNVKVVTRAASPTALAHETGLNQYTRTESPRADIAVDWWKENQATWNNIREFWLQAEQDSGKTFAYTTSHNGTGLSKALLKLEKQKATPSQISNTLRPFLILSK